MHIYFISWNRFWSSLLLVVVAFIFTYGVIQWSEKTGKLAVPPDYDDIHSLVEGGLRLMTASEEGLEGAWSEYKLRHPRSFLHIYWTSLLFAIFGVQASVPYWGNIIFLLVVLVFFLVLLPRPIPTIWKFLWLGVFLGLPICFHLIHDYRSEVAMAALLLGGCAAAVAWAWREISFGWGLGLTALFFATALAMKPVMFPYQLGMLGLCSLVYLAARWCEDEREHRVGERGKNLARSLLDLLLLWCLVLVPSLPHFWIHGEDIFRYMFQNTIESDFWKFTPNAGPSWAFHWLGYAGVWYLGHLHIVAGVVVLLGMVLFFLPATCKWKPDRRWFSLAFLCVGSFAGLAINPIHQPFFGVTFNLLLATSFLTLLAHFFATKGVSLWLPPLMVFLYGLVWLYLPVNKLLIAGVSVGLLAGGFFIHRKVRHRFCLIAFGSFLLGLLGLAYSIKGFMLTFAFVALLLPVVAFRLRMDRNFWVPFTCTGLLAMLVWVTVKPAPFHDYVTRTKAEVGEEGLRWRREGPAKVFALLEMDWDEPRAPVIWVSNFGWVDGNSLTWEALRRGHRWKVYTASEIFNQKERRAALEKAWWPDFADYLVLPEVGITGEIKTPEAKEELRLTDLGSEQWKQSGLVEAPEGRVWIFRNQTPALSRSVIRAHAWVQHLWNPSCSGN